jgi:tRNA threonylcarbamoyladenosine biosynthesis protein TsaB
MLVLGIESSTTQGGVAIVGEDRVLCEAILNVEVTHSERLLPAVDRPLVQIGDVARSV